MKKLLYILIPVLGLVIFYSLSGDESNRAYTEKIEELRNDRIKFLKHSKDSPFQQFEMEFQPLSFYPVNSKYKVRAQLERIQSVQRLTIQNSDGTTSRYNKFGYASFRMAGEQHQLLILKPVGFGVPNTYFTAFADETSGEITYGGGRYLDLEIGKSDNIEIDFNLAYNPYCAYVAGYTCPLPPKENLLTVAIEAGEKDYNH